MATKSDTKKKTTTKKSTVTKKSTTTKKATTAKKTPVKKVVKKTVKMEEPVVVTKSAWYKHPLIVGLASIVICFFLGYTVGYLISMFMG